MSSASVSGRSVFLSPGACVQPGSPRREQHGFIHDPRATIKHCRKGEVVDRRKFIKSSLGSAVALSSASLLASAEIDQRPTTGAKPQTKLAAYYIGANVYTSVPRHIREDMEWMADKGTHYVCISILEQDLFASYENLALMIAEATRVGMQVLAVPSRWGGLVAGAPKAPSLFSVLNPQTWIVNDHGSTKLMSKATGAISSVHSPETFAFFCHTLREMYRQLSQLAGFIIDEPKCFIAERLPTCGSGTTFAAFKFDFP